MTASKRLCARSGLKPVAALTALVIMLLPVTAFAGNDDEILIGTQGARLGGAVTATVTDSTALWYNPGAIGRTRWAQFGVSGTLVQATIMDGGDDVALGVVPATLGHEIPLPNDWAFGYGIFTSQARPAGTMFGTRNTYNFGAGVGAPLGSTLRIGMAAFAVYSDQLAVASMSAVNQQALSSFISLGMHWTATPQLSFGVSVNSPRLFLVTDGYETVTGGGAVADNANFTLAAPVRVRGGVAYDFGGVMVSLDGDVQPALDNDDAGIDRRLVPNGRLGAEIALDEQTNLGLGMFTDLAPEGASAARMNYFGVSGGIETAARYEMGSDESALSMEITAFVGFRYAYGTGDATTAHEIGINLGSGLRF